MKSSNYQVLSLFAGCGGLDLGLVGDFTYLKKHYHKNPFEILVANDNDERAVATYQYNFPDTKIICDDVDDFLGSEENLEKADVIVGGFPCQDFSLAGKRNGLETKRGRLYLSMVEAIKFVQPKIFLAENVKGILTWQGGKAMNEIIQHFTEVGYRVEYRILKMANFGVPQTRERVIIVGVRKDLETEFIWPKSTHFANPYHSLQKWVTLGDAIDDIKEDVIQSELPNFHYSLARRGNVKDRNTNADKLCPTISAEHHGNIAFHYDLPRRLSVREAARVQTFPDSFEFLWTMTDAYRQIGNAVPPVFAWQLAQSLRVTLELIEEKAAKNLSIPRDVWYNEC